MNVPPMTMNSTYRRDEHYDFVASTQTAQTSHLVNTVTQAFQLFHSPSCLFVRIVTRSDGTHASRFISCIALCAIVKVRVWPTGTISILSADKKIEQVSKKQSRTRRYCPSWQYGDSGEVCTLQRRQRSIADGKRVRRNCDNFRTPLAVRIGLAFSFGRSAFLSSSGIALMISTSLGTPPKPYFLLIFARSSLSETDWFAS